MEVLPEAERKKILRLKQVPTHAEISTAESELAQWQQSIREIDGSLKGSSATSSPSSNSKDIFAPAKVAGVKKSLPPVRGSAKVSATSAQGISGVKSVVGGGREDKKTEETASSAEAKARLSGYDFPAWEKFDVDKALHEIDGGEDGEAEQQKTESERQKTEIERSKKEAEKRRRRSLEIDLDRIKKGLGGDEMSVQQRKLIAGTYIGR